MNYSMYKIEPSSSLMCGSHRMQRKLDSPLTVYVTCVVVHTVDRTSLICAVVVRGAFVSTMY